MWRIRWRITRKGEVLGQVRRNLPRIHDGASAGRLATVAATDRATARFLVTRRLPANSARRYQRMSDGVD